MFVLLFKTTSFQGGATGSSRPSYDAPTYAAILIPNYNVIGNKIDAQTLGQVSLVKIMELVAFRKERLRKPFNTIIDFFLDQHPRTAEPPKGR